MKAPQRPDAQDADDANCLRSVEVQPCCKSDHL